MTTLTYPRVVAVSDLAVTVELGASMDAETVGRVRALDVRLRDAVLRGVRETVPTYASLLVIYERSQISFAELEVCLRELCRDLDSDLTSGQLVEVPTVYDGEDLEEVASACGLSRDDVIALHSGREYAVMMLGFSPGFAYMGFVDERLRLPRRKTPRTRVPTGSVAIAGPQTGIYPRSLPGGWNLLGRTSLSLFDPSPTVANRPGPSLLTPGDRVRFIPATTLHPIDPPPDWSYEGDGVEILEAGLFTTVQDSGRCDFRRVAVPWAGFADAVSARVANRCVGNSDHAAAIEICGPGLKLRFLKSTFVALAGANVSARLERSDLESGGTPLPPLVAIRVRPGNVLIVDQLDGGTRAYLAIAGLNPKALLGSASVDLGSGFLRPLASGDRLGIGAFDADRAHREPFAVTRQRSTVRVILGPQAHHFDEAGIASFLDTSWRIGLDSDRVGARLDGGRVAHTGPNEIISDGMVPGCIQIPPDGRPIVMLSDCPTTGGYPKIACVVSEDIGIIAQAIPGRTEIRFVAVKVDAL